MASGELHAKRPADTAENEKHSDDTLWREFLSGSFHHTLRSVLPEMAKAVDLLRPIRFLDAELRRLARFTRRYSGSPPDGRRFVTFSPKGGRSAVHQPDGKKRNEEGREEGILIGTEQTKRDNAIRMLRKEFGTADVSECVDLPEEEVRRLAEEMKS